MAEPDAYAMNTLGIVICTVRLTQKSNRLWKLRRIVHDREEIALIAKRFLVHNDDSDGACILQLRWTPKSRST